MKFCSKCTVVLRPHRELVWWLQCPVCAFTGFYPEEIHWIDREKALANKMVTWDGHLAKYNVWKPREPK